MNPEWFHGDDALAYPVPVAAKKIGIGATLAWELVRTGAIQHIRINRRVVVPREALETYLRGKLEGGRS